MDLLKTCEEYIGLVKQSFENNDFSHDKWNAIDDLAREIFAKFGLPLSFELSEFAQSAALSEDDPEKACSRFVELLSARAANYLMSPASTNSKILESGKLDRIPFDNILPYMNIESHSYCVYIYEELYCKDKISVEETIAALQTFSDDDLTIQQLIHYNGEYALQINFEAYWLLKEKKIPFLEEFIQHEIDIRSRSVADDKNWRMLFERGRKLPFLISVTHFYIIKIECYQYSNDCFLNIISEERDEQWYGIVVYCKKDEMNAIISHSRFNVDSSLVRTNLAENVLVLDLKKDFFMRHLEIVDFTLDLTMIVDDDNSTKSPGFYTVSLPGKTPSFYRDDKPNSELPF